MINEKNLRKKILEMYSTLRKWLHEHTVRPVQP